jgi:hypothetical protein
MANGRPWSHGDTATLTRMAGSGASDREIAGHMGRGVKMIGRKRRALGIERGVSPALAAMLARMSGRKRRLVRV